MTTPQIPSAALAELLELTARMLHSRGYAEGLFPAQWVALRYFQKARPDLCTASELARFQGLANGPVSRTVRTLVQKGLLRKAPVQPKGRAELLQLSEAGQALMAQDPSLPLQEALDSIEARDRESFARSLEAILRRMSKDTGSAG